MRKNLLSKVFGVVAALTMATSATVGTASAADGTWSTWDYNHIAWTYYPIYNYQVKYPTLIKNNGYFGWNYRNTDITGECHCDSIQTMLQITTDPNLAVDGILGKNSDKAIKNFQTKKGLYSDGIVGRDTYKALAKSSNVYNKKDFKIIIAKRK